MNPLTNWLLILQNKLILMSIIDFLFLDSYKTSDSSWYSSKFAVFCFFFIVAKMLAVDLKYYKDIKNIFQDLK